MKTQLAENAAVDAPTSRQSVNAATEPTIKGVKAVNAVNPVSATPVVKAAVKAVSVDVLYDENLLEHTGGLPVFMDDTTRVWLERVGRPRGWAAHGKILPSPPGLPPTRI